MSTTNESKREMLSLDKYFYEKELEAAKTPDEKSAIADKIRMVEQLLIELND